MYSGEWNVEDPGASTRLKRALGRLPMFPLPDLVLFPHALQPLHVFEPRYKQMVRDALDTNRLLVMARRLEPEGDTDILPRVATVAGVGDIVMCEQLDDGCFNLIVYGRARVRITREHEQADLYRTVATKLFPDDPPKNLADLAEAEASLRALIEGLAHALPEGGTLLKHVAAAQHTASELADVMSSALVLEPDERQALLETTDVLARYERLTTAAAAMTARVPGGRPAN